MKRLILCICFFSVLSAFSQIPLGFSTDTLIMPISQVKSQILSYYKPNTYNSVNSPIVFVIHGIGGTGLSAVNSFYDIADRRGALLVGINLESPGITMDHASATYNAKYDTTIPTNQGCVMKRPATDLMKFIYRDILSKENRNSIDSYMIGFSAGGQFTNRYNTYRQAYPDSIPFKMIVSSNAYYYTFPTDTLNGVAMPFFGLNLCGLLMPELNSCNGGFDFYNFDCPKNIAQIYRSNYGILIGTADTDSIGMGVGSDSCFFAQGISRYERANKLYQFGLANAQQQGLEFNWQYREVIGIGHDVDATYHAVQNAGDIITVAEALLFDSPYIEPIITSPVASYKINGLWGSNVAFTNTSSNATHYFWDFGDGYTSTEENPTHHYTVPGTFTVQLRASDDTSCENWHFLQNVVEITMEDIQSIENGISENEENESFVVYPNPNKGHFTIQTLGDLNCNFEIINALGQIILKNTSLDKNQIINLNVEKGIYFILIKVKNGEVVKKIIIE